MNRDELIKQLQAMDENGEIVIDLETTYDGKPIDINNCSVVSVYDYGSKIVINAEDPLN